MRRAAATCLLALLPAACMSRSPELEPGTLATAGLATLRLSGGPVLLHLVRPEVIDRPLVLFVTGDGGWRSGDRLVFARLGAWGYPLAGIDARDYLHHLGDSPTDPRGLARDYGRLLDFATARLGLPEATPAVLAGFSRGAGLAVVAATEPALRARLCGVLALALPDEEEHVFHRRRRRIADPYAEAARLAPLRLAVIQSTRDDYVSAAHARELLGSDGPGLRLYSIPSGGHTFGGGRELLLEKVGEALGWLCGAGRL